MKIAGVNFPEELLEALRDNNLVVFAGAGVSMGAPSCLPDMQGLIEKIEERTTHSKCKSEEMDEYLNRIKRKEEIPVHELVAEELNKDGLEPNALHKDIVRLFLDKEHIKIVTTNFDKLFERVAYGDINAPAKTCSENVREFSGIVHLHGSVDDPDNMILTDTDFGRAYMSDGWASRFMTYIFQEYTVLFIGYSYNDRIMYYLTMGLQEDAEKGKYILTPEVNEDQGKEDQDEKCPGKEDPAQRMDFKKITYKGSEDSKHHEHLQLCIKKLAVLRNRVPSAWNKEISDIASKPPNIDESSDTLLFALRYEKGSYKVKTFANNAKAPEWIEWLDDNKFLGNLFNDSVEISYTDSNFAGCLMDAFADKHYSHLFKLFDKHDMKLDKLFWSYLVKRIFTKTIVKDKKAMHLWAAILIDLRHEYSHHDHELSRMVTYCASNNLYDLALAAFEPMVTWKTKINIISPMDAIEADIPLGQEKNQPMINVNPYLTYGNEVVMHAHYMKRVWEDGLQPNLDKIAEPLLEIAIKSMQMMYAIARTGDQKDSEFDAFSYRRSAIEKHEQNKFPKAVDVLIYCARDCLEWIAVNNQDLAIVWYIRLITSDIKIFQRLAVHVLPFIKRITADEKIDYLVNDISLHDRAAHHEIYTAIEKLYPDASAVSRQKVIDLICEYEWSHSDDPQERKFYSVRSHYDLIEWISRKDPDCDLAAAALNRIKSTPEYSNFDPKDHTEFTTYIETMEPVISSISYKQLLSNTPDYWYPQLVAVDKDNREDIFSFGNELHKASQEDFNWGYGLAEILHSKNEWDSYLWPWLIMAWTANELEEAQYEKILNLLQNDIYSRYSQDVAKFLYSYVKRNINVDELKLLDQFTNIADAISEIDEGTPSTPINYYRTAINSTEGILTEFWIMYIDHYKKSKSTIAADGINSIFDKLESFIKDENNKSILACSIIASHLNFLLGINEEWVRNNLLPVLSDKSNKEKYTSAWTGLLYRIGPNPLIVELLEKPLLELLPEAKSNFDDIYDRFIEIYVSFLHYVKEPRVFAYEFIKKTEKEELINMTRQIEMYIRNLEDSEQKQIWDTWLRQYMLDRQYNIPKKIVEGEVEAILGWLPCMKSIFPDAVDVFIKFTDVRLEDMSLFSFEDNELLDEYPEHVAKLLIHLGKGQFDDIAWMTYEAIYKKLITCDLPEDVKEELEELKLRVGFG